MSDQIEITVRLGSFLCIFLLMTLWEVLTPRRQLTVRKGPRWASNLGLVALNTVLVRLIIPITSVGVARAGPGIHRTIELCTPSRRQAVSYIPAVQPVDTGEHLIVVTAIPPVGTVNCGTRAMFGQHASLTCQPEFRPKIKIFGTVIRNRANVLLLP